MILLALYLGGVLCAVSLRMNSDLEGATDAGSWPEALVVIALWPLLAGVTVGAWAWKRRPWLG